MQTLSSSFKYAYISWKKWYKTPVKQDLMRIILFRTYDFIINSILYPSNFRNVSSVTVKIRQFHFSFFFCCVPWSLMYKCSLKQLYAYIFIISRMNSSHYESERNFTERKRDGIPCVYYIYMFSRCRHVKKFKICNQVNLSIRKVIYIALFEVHTYCFLCAVSQNLKNSDFCTFW